MTPVIVSIHAASVASPEARTSRISGNRKNIVVASQPETKPQRLAPIVIRLCVFKRVLSGREKTSRPKLIVNIVLDVQRTSRLMIYGFY